MAADTGDTDTEPTLLCRLGHVSLSLSRVFRPDSVEASAQLCWHRPGRPDTHVPVDFVDVDALECVSHTDGSEHVTPGVSMWHRPAHGRNSMVGPIFLCNASAVMVVYPEVAFVYVGPDTSGHDVPIKKTNDGAATGDGVAHTVHSPLSSVHLDWEVLEMPIEPLLAVSLEGLAAHGG